MLANWRLASVLPVLLGIGTSQQGPVISFAIAAAAVWKSHKLLLVDLMFALFVGIQFFYFFGGAANITLTRYTYADYARRGFFRRPARRGPQHLSRRHSPGG